MDKIAFTGSTEVGRAIRKATAGTGKKLSLELGGKSPFIVFEDADLDSAVEGVVDAIWFNQGQVCCAGSRLLVAESVAEALYAKLRARMANLRVGDPLDKSTDVGAIVAPAQLERIKRLMREGEQEGLEFFRADESLPARGCFYPPTLVTGVEPASVLAREEIFGPVLVATTFRTPDEAVGLANNTRYGLAASVWSENVNRALEVAARIKAGVVWINSTNMFDAASGFGGYRESGFGREGGREGLFEYRTADEPKMKTGSAKPARLNAAPGLFPAGAIAGASLDRTAKLYIGGKQARPDSGYSYAVLDPAGRKVGLAGLGNRKDIRNAVEAAKAAAEKLGFETEIDSNPWDEDYRQVARSHLASVIALSEAQEGKPVCLIAGGEVTCPVTGPGVGGRNQAYTLYAAQSIPGQSLVILSAGTDGRDGNSPTSGAVADGQTISRAQALGMNPAHYLAESDSYSFFRCLGDTVDIGYMDNNLRDVRVWLDFGRKR